MSIRPCSSNFCALETSLPSQHTRKGICNNRHSSFPLWFLEQMFVPSCTLFLKQVAGRGVGGQGLGRKALISDPRRPSLLRWQCSARGLSPSSMVMRGPSLLFHSIGLGLGHTALGGATLAVSTLHGGRCQHGLATQTVGGRTFS